MAPIYERDLYVGDDGETDTSSGHPDPDMDSPDSSTTVDENEQQEDIAGPNLQRTHMYLANQMNDVDIMKACILTVGDRTSLPETSFETTRRVIDTAQAALALNKIATKELSSTLQAFECEKKQTQKFRKHCAKLQEAVDKGLSKTADLAVQQGIVGHGIKDFYTYLNAFQTRVNNIKALSEEISTAGPEILRLKQLYLEHNTKEGGKEMSRGHRHLYERGEEPSLWGESEIVTTHGGTEDLFDRSNSQDTSNVCEEQPDLTLELKDDDQRTAGPTYKCAWAFPPLEGGTEPVPCGAKFYTLPELKKHKQQMSLTGVQRHFDYNEFFDGELIPRGNCGLDLIRPMGPKEGSVCQGLQKGGKDNHARRKHLVDRPHTIDYKLLHLKCHVCDQVYQTDQDFNLHLQKKKYRKCVIPGVNKTVDEMKRKATMDLVDELAIVACQPGSKKKQKIEGLKEKLVTSLNFMG